MGAMVRVQSRARDVYLGFGMLLGMFPQSLLA